MTDRAPRYRSSTPLTPINFRMPAKLRSRLRRFAEERSIGESDALRVIVSEHLDGAERERDLSAAEEWQLEQVYATLRKRGRAARSVADDEIAAAFARARQAAGRSRGSRGRHSP